MEYSIADLKLAKAGQERIDWAFDTMDVLKQIRERFARERPLAGATVFSCLHMTTETANLIINLKAAGAHVVAAASNPLSTQDDVCAALVKVHKVPVFARRGVKKKEFYQYIHTCLDYRPHLVLDDGGDVASLITRQPPEKNPNIIGATEETTTGVVRLNAIAREGKLRFPVVAVNESKTKHIFDNPFGVGQSALDGITRATNRLYAGSVFVVCGYGWCGRGLADRARGMGAQVIVTEVNPLKALEAVMNGFRVMPIVKAAAVGDIFCSVTGDINVIHEEAIQKMKDGAILSQAGHFNVEVEIPALEKLKKSKREVRRGVTRYVLKDGRNINLLGEGRLVNLVCAEGHPSSVMDMSFANQCLGVEHLIKNHEELEPRVHVLPEAIDLEIARLKLASMGVEFDRLSKQQEEYLCSWKFGT